MTAPDKPEPPQRAGSWHESLATVAVVFIFGAVLTSPCWALALMAWVAK